MMAEQYQAEIHILFKILGTLLTASLSLVYIYIYMYHQLGVVFLPDFSKSGYDLLNLDTLIVKHTDIRNYCGLVLYPRRYIRKQIRENRLNYIYRFAMEYSIIFCNHHIWRQLFWYQYFTYV